MSCIANCATLVAVTLVLNNLHLLFFRSSDSTSSFVYDICQYFLFIFFLSFLFKETPRTNFKLRACCLALIFMFASLTMSLIYDTFDICLFWIQYPLGILICAQLIYSIFSWGDIKEVKSIDPNKSYFLFKKPKNTLDFIITLFRFPVSSFSIITSDKWYKFSRNVDKLYITKYNNDIFKYYDIVEVEDIDPKSLESLEGTSWSVKDSNCITAFKPVFSSMDMKLSTFDFIPSIFAYKFFKDRK